MYREVHQHWPALEWGCRTDLPVLGLGSLQLHLPMLTSLPTSALPAAVAAALLDHPAAHKAQQQQQAQQQQARLVQDEAQKAQQLRDPGGPAAPAAGGLAAGAAAEAAELAGHPATASPAEVAAALADELDDATGIPLCLLPDAYGKAARSGGSVCRAGASRQLSMCAHDHLGDEPHSPCRATCRCASIIATFSRIP